MGFNTAEQDSAGVNSSSSRGWKGFPGRRKEMKTWENMGGERIFLAALVAIAGIWCSLLMGLL